MASQIHWFPGHMNKALKEIGERIKIVDVIIEIFDARIPLSSINENLGEITKNKKKLIVLAKNDLADPAITEIWKEELNKQFDKVLVLNLKEGSAQNAIAKAVSEIGKEKQQKDIARGMKPQPIKAMIIGIPNVGKSSLINRLSGRSAAGVQNKPGYTRGEQWIKVNKDFLLLDTPGILPMAYENKKKAINLALVGSIKEDILPNTDLSVYLLEFLKLRYPNALKERFGVSEIKDYETTIKEICLNRSLIKNNSEPDIARAEVLLLKEFKDGKLGKISLENPKWL